MYARNLLRAAAMLLGIAMAVTLGTNAATAAPPGSDAELVRAPLTLNCADMTSSAREYAVANRLCTADGRPVEKPGTFGVVTGNCGSSWMWISNANGGNARFVYGYASSQGTVIAHVLRVSWYNWATGGANGWTDAAGRLSSSYESNQVRFTGAGYVTAGLSGFVTLWWGGTCTLLNPTDGVTVRP
jgi:hypothetical protein